MQKGWDARGRLAPLWGRLPGKRDELATLTGIGPNTLSSYNSGRRQLGQQNAERIADALTQATGVEVTMEDLGAPPVKHPEIVLLTEIVQRLEQDASRAAGDLAPLLRQLADDLSMLAFRLRQATMRQGKRWRNG